MTVGTLLRRSRLEKHYDSIVIGSGIGGLSAACILAKAGHKVLVLERHYTAGGFTHSFGRNGYEWDVGVHYIGDVHRPHTPIRKIFDYISDGKLQWAEMPEVYDQIHIGTETFDYVKGEKAFAAQMTRYFPEQKAAIYAYLQLIKKVNRAASLAFSLQALPYPLAKCLSPLLRKEYLRYAQQSTEEVLSRLSSDKKLQAVLAAQWGDYGLPPSRSSFVMHALLAKHYLNGASYPVGGSTRIAESIADVLKQNGAELITGAEVQEILCQDEKAVGVKLHDGQTIFARHIISAVGARNTLLQLLPKDHAQRAFYQKSLAPLSTSMAHLGLYLGLKHDLSELQIPASNLWIYEESDHEKILAYLNGDYQGKFPLVYISFPSHKDPTWKQRFEGKSTIEIVAPIPYRWFERWKDRPWQKRGSDYTALKENMSAQLLEVLYQKFPQLRGKIHYQELSTPLSTQHFCNYEQGEIYGLAHSPQRFTQTWLRTDTRVPQLFLTGQDIVSCGIGGALSAGALTAFRILGPWRGRHLLRLF